MEIDRRGFFGRMIGGVVAGMMAPKILPEVTTFKRKPIIWDYPPTATEVIMFDDRGYDSLRYLLHQKIDEAQNGIASMWDKVMLYRPMQLPLFPPHVPQVPLEDGWAAWEDAEQLELDLSDSIE